MVTLFSPIFSRVLIFWNLSSESSSWTSNFHLEGFFDSEMSYDGGGGVRQIFAKQNLIGLDDFLHLENFRLIFVKIVEIFIMI